MTTLNADIKQAIKEKLPQMIGEELQKRFAELEKKEAELENMFIRYDTLQNEKNRLESRNKELGDLDNKIAVLTNLQTEVAKREFNLEKNILEIKLAESEKRGAWAEGLAMGIVRNTEYRSRIADYKTEQVPFQYQGGGGTGTTNVSNSHIHEEDKTAH